jgi:hypothetical protein
MNIPGPSRLGNWTDEGVIKILAKWLMAIWGQAIYVHLFISVLTCSCEYSWLFARVPVLLLSLDRRMRDGGTTHGLLTLPVSVVWGSSLSVPVRIEWSAGWAFPVFASSIHSLPHSCSSCFTTCYCPCGFLLFLFFFFDTNESEPSLQGDNYNSFLLFEFLKIQWFRPAICSREGLSVTWVRVGPAGIG